ncbi:Wall-associated receptor kinase 3 [Hordeum vulgare]|nr:Wall-associated receptor kinase 3 [Hordeum vulgare]
MDREASSNRHSVLERMLLDENAEPTDLPLSLLEDITDRFSPDQEIGSGGFSVVYKGMIGKQMVAVKKLSNTVDITESKFHGEVKCLIKTKHKNIVRFLGYCADTQGKMAEYEGKLVMADVRNWLLCFEFVPKGSLDKHMSDASCGLEWRERYRIIRGICEGLHYLHEKRILHLDLKPANVLLDIGMVPKIADFGLSRCFDEGQTRAITQHLCGSQGYLAPEFYRGQIAFASDIYSLGVIIMEILTGAKGYFEEEDVVESWMNRLHQAPERHTQLEQVRVCTKIGIECMDLDPKKRPLVRHIIDRLDKTARAHYSCQTGMSSSLVKLQPSLLKEQSGEIIEKLADESFIKDINERPVTEDHCQQGQENADQWSSQKAQDTELKVNQPGTSIFGSKSSFLEKLQNLNIFSGKAHMNFLGNVSGLTIFTKAEIKNITKNNSVFLGPGRFCKVYKGTLPDNSVVAVKTYMALNDDMKQEFMMMINIHKELIHKNIIKLYGCCLEADIPTLVFEFAVNGNLWSILHHSKRKLPLDSRLGIAIGSAEGLRYMHSYANYSIQHGDVRPINIFLDDKLIPKIGNFAFSRLHNLQEEIRLEASESSDTSMLHDMGYLDLEFMGKGRVTQKSDVYSFGAILLELITRKRNVFDKNCVLTIEYRKLYEREKSGRAMFDKKIATENNDIFALEEIGKVAIECLKEDSKERPDMTEVMEQLMMIRRNRRLIKARNNAMTTSVP